MSCRECRQLFLILIIPSLAIMIRFTSNISAQKYDYFPSHKTFLSFIYPRNPIFIVSWVISRSLFTHETIFFHFVGNLI